MLDLLLMTVINIYAELFGRRVSVCAAAAAVAARLVSETKFFYFDLHWQQKRKTLLS